MMERISSYKQHYVSNTVPSTTVFTTQLPTYNQKLKDYRAVNLSSTLQHIPC